MEILIQRIFDGLGDGAVYSLVAIALVLVHRATGVFNFAQGEMGMIAAFVAWYLWGGAGWPLPLAVLAGVVAGMALGVVVERLVIRPLRGRDHMIGTLSTLGVYLACNALAAFLFTSGTEIFPSMFPSGSLRFAGIALRWDTLGLLVTVLVVSLLMWLVFKHTSIGLALEATSSDAVSSSLVGINIDANRTLGWALAGGLGALAAILVAPTLSLSTHMMGSVLMYGFAAAVVGGLDSPFGAVIGGLGVGLVQSLAAGYVPFVGPQLQLLTAMVIILVVLRLRPQGLYGKKQVSRVCG